jgi:plasmid stabilization system protein ParE
MISQTPTAAPYSVELSTRAILDLLDIRAFIASRGAPLAAQRHAIKLERLIEKLEQFPQRGRHVGGGVRQLTAVAPHVVRYRIRGAIVQVIRIRHGAMKTTW